MVLYIEAVSTLGIVYSDKIKSPDLKSECRYTWTGLFAFNMVLIIVGALNTICIMDKELNSHVFSCHIFCISATILGFLNHFIIILGCQGVLYFENPTLFKIIMLMFLGTIINFVMCNITSAGAKRYAVVKSVVNKTGQTDQKNHIQLLQMVDNPNPNTELQTVKIVL